MRKTDPILLEPNMTNEIWTFQRSQIRATKASVRLDKKLRNDHLSAVKGHGRTPAPQRCMFHGRHRIAFHHHAWRRKMASDSESASPPQYVCMKTSWEDVWWGLLNQEVDCLVCYCSGCGRDFSALAVFFFFFCSIKRASSWERGWT